MYPLDGCDYLALSCMWRGVEQPSFELGEILPAVPATLEDAMVVTHGLGKKCLRADSLCIDHEDSAGKVVHIAVISAICSGAWATIICLSDQSAASGLPRVGMLEGVVPQLSCKGWGKMPLSVVCNAYSSSTGLVVALEVWNVDLLGRIALATTSVLHKSPGLL